MIFATSLHAVLSGKRRLLGLAPFESDFTVARLWIPGSRPGISVPHCAVGLDLLRLYELFDLRLQHVQGDIVPVGLGH